MPKPLNLKLVL